MMRLCAMALLFIVAMAASVQAETKPHFISGDNYNASQFSAPGLGPTFGDTIKMLIGRNVDSPSSKTEHGAGQAEGAARGLLHSYDQVKCSTFCRTVPGGLDPDSNEAYEACLGPCFKCAQISIRAQAEAGATDVGQEAFNACYQK